ncbi:hypothetical protein scyTo_0021097 [Scyliorhinus torazame]|uniref:EF-hand domain-containing protein n=1 Tax=Scyliorhinus torazame TaxID=75743 RepID=A0A401PW35_SCYTO|nr:hypothetical protein [Scyliorhinus torazame]
MEKRGVGQSLADDRVRKREGRKKWEADLGKSREDLRAGSHQPLAEENQSGGDHLLRVENVVTVVVKVVEKVVGELVEKLNMAEVVEKLEDLRRATGEGADRQRGRPGGERGESAAEGWAREAKEEGEEDARETADVVRGATGGAERTTKERAPEPVPILSTPNQHRAFRQVFDLLLERAGRPIDFQAFQSLLRAENVIASEAKAHKAFRRLDSNKDGKVCFDDFYRTLTSTNLFLQFIAELPNSCPSCELQKGYVSDTVFFDILLQFLSRKVISEDSIWSITHYYYLKWRKSGPGTKGDRAAGQPKAGNTFLGMPLRSIQALIESSEPEEQGHGQHLPGRLVVAFYEVFQMLVGDHEGRIGTTDLLSVMYQMQIPLKNPLIPDDLKFTTLGAGREVDFEAFLSIMSDYSTFAQFLAPKCLECKSSRFPELLFFQLLLKVLTTPTLKGRSKGIITSYYHEKFRESLHRLPDPAQERTPAEAERERKPGTASGKEVRKATIMLRRRPSSRPVKPVEMQQLHRQARAPMGWGRRSRRQQYQQFKPATRDPYFQQVVQEYIGAFHTGTKQPGTKRGQPERRATR